MSSIDDKDVLAVAEKLWRDLDTPRSLTCRILARYEEFGQLVKLTIDQHSYLDSPWGVEKLRRDYQATELLRKYEGFTLDGVDRVSIAKNAFWDTESQCKRTNDRLSRFLGSEVVFGLDGDDVIAVKTGNQTLMRHKAENSDHAISEFIRDVRKIIKTILGPLPADLEGRFGPGATFESRGHKFRKRYTLGDKMLTKPTVTPGAALLSLFFVDQTAWVRELVKSGSYQSPQIVNGNRFTTVNKDATKDRGICIEPGYNVFLQLAVGRFIRERLLKIAAIDLEQGQEDHAWLAWFGSLEGELATIDLSSASDTVARKLVQLLLPREWYELLDDLRSHKTLIDGHWVYLEKFSSMGNGFTFELETLIFYAIAMVASRQRLGDKRVKVYGDDIIVPRERARDVIASLRWFGFTPNTRKTFFTGLFRESCGGDFFCGQNVRPYYIKESPHEAADWLGICNGISRAGRQARGNWSLGPYRRAWLDSINRLPATVKRCVGPVGLGDIVLHVPEDRYNTAANVKWSQRWFKTWSPVQHRIPWNRFEHVQLALALYGVEGESLPLSRWRPSTCSRWSWLPKRNVTGHPGLPYRDNISGYRIKRVAYS